MAKDTATVIYGKQVEYRTQAFKCTIFNGF